MPAPWHVREDTRIEGASGAFTVPDAAVLGGYDVEAMLETAEEMVRRGVLRWAGDRLVFAPRLVKR